MYSRVKAENEEGKICFQRLKEEMMSFLSEKRKPWTSIIDVQKARLPNDSVLADKIPLLESLGTSDVPAEMLAEDIILQILPLEIRHEYQSYGEDKVVLGQDGDAAVKVISVLLFTQYAKRPNCPPDDRFVKNPEEEEDVLAKYYQPIYQRGCESASTTFKATSGIIDVLDDDDDNNDRGVSETLVGDNPVASTSDDDDTENRMMTLEELRRMAKAKGGRKNNRPSKGPKGGSKKHNSKGYDYTTH